MAITIWNWTFLDLGMIKLILFIIIRLLLSDFSKKNHILIYPVPLGHFPLGLLEPFQNYCAIKMHH